MSSEYASLEVEKVILHPLVDGVFGADEAVHKAYVDNKVSSSISALVDGASGAYDTLKEIETALSANAGSASSEILNKVAEEKKERQDADVVLDGKITSEANARGVAVSAERDARVAAANAENVLRVAAEDALRADIATESVTRGEFINELENTKLSKFGGSLEGELNVTGGASILMEDTYIYFGNNWRVKAASDGSRLTFEHKKPSLSEVQNSWKVALPFIAPQ